MVINLNFFRKIDSDKKKQTKQNKGVYDLLPRYTRICFHQTVNNNKSNNDNNKNNNKNKKKPESFHVFKSIKRIKLLITADKFLARAY